MSPTQTDDDWWADPLSNGAEHAPERDLDPVASARAGVDIHRAACRCTHYIGPEVRTSADLWAAYTLHMADVQAAAHAH